MDIKVEPFKFISVTIGMHLMTMQEKPLEIQMSDEMYHQLRTEVFYSFQPYLPDEIAIKGHEVSKMKLYGIPIVIKNELNDVVRLS